MPSDLIRGRNHIRVNNGPEKRLSNHTAVEAWMF